MALDPVQQQVQQDMAGGAQVNRMVDQGVQRIINRNVPQRFTGRFSDAFNKARSIGAQSFNWNGKLYNTKVAGPQQPEMARSGYTPGNNMPNRPAPQTISQPQWGGQPQFQPGQQQAPAQQAPATKPATQEPRSAYTPPNNTPARPAAIAPKPAQWGSTPQYQPQQAPAQRVKPKAEPELQHSAYRPPLQKSAYRPPSLVGNMMGKAPQFKPVGFKG